MDFAGDELQLRIRVRGAAVVHQRHPAVEVRAFLVAADGEDVVRAPVHVAGQIGSLDALRVRAAIFERPDQRGPAIEIAGQIGEAIGIGAHARDDFVADLPHRSVVVGEQQRFRGDPLRRAGVGFRAHQRHLAAHVFLQQLLRVEQVVFVVLLDHAELRGIGERAEVHGRGIDGRGDVLEPQRENSRLEMNLANVADQREIRVIDRDGKVGLILFRGLARPRPSPAFRRARPPRGLLSVFPPEAKAIGSPPGRPYREFVRCVIAWAVSFA